MISPRHIQTSKTAKDTADTNCTYRYVYWPSMFVAPKYQTQLDYLLVYCDDGVFVQRNALFRWVVQVYTTCMQMSERRFIKIIIILWVLYTM